MENTIQIESKIEEKKPRKPRKPKNPEEIKDRSNVNVSLRKRDRVLLNNILNTWEKEDCNISSEVCDAIILKNISNTNPHIQTILSTLGLIESSLKSHLTTKNISSEEITSHALSIFNEVITIDIDGNKLTNLIKGIGLNKLNLKIKNEDYIKENVVEKSNKEIPEIEKANIINIEKNDNDEIIEHIKNMKNNTENKENEITSIKSRETVSSNESIKNTTDEFKGNHNENSMDNNDENEANKGVDALLGGYTIKTGFQL